MKQKIITLLIFIFFIPTGLYSKQWNQETMGEATALLKALKPLVENESFSNQLGHHISSHRYNKPFVYLSLTMAQFLDQATEELSDDKMAKKLEMFDLLATWFSTIQDTVAIHTYSFQSIIITIPIKEGLSGEIKQTHQLLFLEFWNLYVPHIEALQTLHREVHLPKSS